MRNQPPPAPNDGDSGGAGPGPAPPERALIEAVYEDDAATVERLLAAGAGGPAEATDEEGQTALYLAAVSGRVEILGPLLAAGADPGRLSGVHGDLPLCGAACNGHTETVLALLAAGADPDQREAFGYTPLAWAVRRGGPATVRALLAGGADPAVRGPQDDLPLVTAAREGSLPVVRALLAHGAPGRAEALAEAREWLGKDVARMLRDELVEAYGPGAETVTERVPEEDGGTVVVTLLRDGVPAAGNSRGTDHAEIVALLAAAAPDAARHSG
ncbi:ankyrin repeat domain-containing protein [Streptomyces sp. LP05-1]|uniref:Ankyrin repeat domain-containing protein n=1 Tax=Streptomyces pyxinae TaxID=2970734 RepID=A0ABT2CQX7_9ACTN|nr:ankyrin repeat domain-containing protein [Streptomyces sp. LP05-1]MCS0639823.1 ankyrin repeat domain-containing protein [Streptomyces sp. LP05-1]